MHSHIDELSRLCWIMLATRSARGDSSSTMCAYLGMYVRVVSVGRMWDAMYLLPHYLAL